MKKIINYYTFIVLFVSISTSVFAQLTLSTPSGTVVANSTDSTFAGIGIGTLEPRYAIDIIGPGQNQGYIRLRGYSQAGYTNQGLIISSNARMEVRHYPNYGTGYLRITNGGSGILLGTNERVHFGALPGIDNVSERFNFVGGKAMMDTLVIGNFVPATDPGLYNFPSGFKFGVGGRSHFRDFVSIGSDCFEVPDDPKVILGVKGKIFAEGLKLKLENETCWGDHVFNENYHLYPIHQLENYIKANQHLPEVPSAKDLVKNGLEVSEMMKIQMQKIEELTLYIIQQQKEIEEQKIKINMLEKKLEAVLEK